MCVHSVERDRPCTDNVILRSVRATTIAVEKQYFIIYSECAFVALVTQHAMRMGHIAIRGLYYSTVCFHIIS